MTYSSGGLIQASDINGLLVDNTNNLNTIWSTGAGSSGYGQTAVATVAAGDIISVTPWASLVNNITTIANHQGTSITATTAPVTGNLISYLSAVTTNLTTVTTNKLNAAGQGSTTTSVATSGITWSNQLTMSFTVTFSSQNAARYFFNAGGQIGINCSHPAGSGSSINQLISNIAGDLGTIWLSSPTSGSISLTGSSYNGVTKSGGSNPSGLSINANYGFYSWTSSLTQVVKQFGDAIYHSYGTGTFVQINVASNGSGQLNITVVFDEVPNGATVSSGTQSTLTVRPPSSTYLTNTWGTPSLSNSVTGS